LQFGKLRFPVESPLIGKINVYNILAACAAGLTYGLGPEVIARGIAALKAVPGRFERVDEGQPFVVVVDYAHTDDALRNVIAVARGLNPKRVITLFGCGGDRDRAKRPLMGQAAAEASDFVVLTSDNPRSEDPLAIMNDALVGIRRVDVPHVVEPDRQAAIRRALKEAREGDIVILAGKGHETYQVLKDKTIDFDDRAVAREVLKGYGYHKTQ
jgi:UDP-N-acetylmuramoyl-L-alanyl-D-glutamate--2,6-diaminopimelate ligase